MLGDGNHPAGPGSGLHDLQGPFQERGIRLGIDCSEPFERAQQVTVAGQEGAAVLARGKMALDVAGGTRTPVGVLGEKLADVLTLQRHRRNPPR